MRKIEMKQVSFAYDEEDVIKDVSLTIPEEKGCVLLAGENGSGKSTLLMILCGLLKPIAGKLIREDVHIAYLPFDSPLFPNLTIKENLCYFYRNFHGLNISFNDPEIIELLDILHIDYGNQRFEKCSSGQKQKASIACILVSKAPMIVLDEPFIAVDMQTTTAILQYIQKAKENTLFLITSHTMGQLPKIIDRILFLEKGVLSKDIHSKEEIYQYFKDSMESSLC